MAFLLTLTRPVTDDELRTMAERNPGFQFERDPAGVLIVTPTGSESGRRSLELGRQLGNWTITDRTGVAFDSSTGFRLPDGAVYAPDASWVRRDRWEALTRDEQRGFAPLCPDVVFEIASESDNPSELRKKMAVYLAGGARLGVLVLPQSRTVELYRPGAAMSQLMFPHEVALDPELSGFILQLDELFTS
jgi:Uma2 family endonuclease